MHSFLSIVVFSLVVLSQKAAAGVAEDWDRYYKFSGPSLTSGQSKLSWKYKVKLIFHVMGNINDQDIPVRTTADGKAFCAVVSSHLGKDIHSRTITGPPTPYWVNNQQNIRWSINNYLTSHDLEMARRYFDPRGLKHHQRYTYEWREGDCIVRVSEFPGVQTTLSFHDITDRQETDLPFLEHLLKTVDPNTPIATNPKAR